MRWRCWISTALAVPPSVLDGHNADTIIVATMQAFKQADTERLAVYRANGALMGCGIDGSGWSLVEVLAAPPVHRGG